MATIKATKLSLKYASIQSKVQTGASARTAPKALTQKQLVIRRAEIFKRLKPARCFDVIMDVRFSQVNNESVFDLIQNVNQPTDPSDETRSVISIVDSASEGGFSSLSDFLLVDMRTAEEFRESRIMFARSYPMVNLARDIFPPEIFRFKNKVKGRALVVYHSDDKMSSTCATQLMRKGWEEVWVLNGGFEEFIAHYPEAVDEGE
jgi:rhodanese-related sulfurtransferase